MLGFCHGALSRPKVAAAKSVEKEAATMPGAVNPSTYSDLYDDDYMVLIDSKINKYDIDESQAKSLTRQTQVLYGIEMIGDSIASYPLNFTPLGKPIGIYSDISDAVSFGQICSIDIPAGIYYRTGALYESAYTGKRVLLTKTCSLSNSYLNRDWSCLGIGPGKVNWDKELAIKPFTKHYFD